MTRIIGITGGIGSGKSTLASCFLNAGIPVLDADAISRTALSPDSPCFPYAVSLFGSQVVLPDGTLDRSYIADRVFHDTKLLRKLNAIVHPYVMHTLLERTEDCDQPLIVWDVPLLFESDCDAFCACTVAVLCRKSIRIKRVMQRDGSTEEQVRARMAKQTTDAFRKASATYTIRNEEDEAPFRKNAELLIEQIRKELT